MLRIEKNKSPLLKSRKTKARPLWSELSHHAVAGWLGRALVGQGHMLDPGTEFSVGWAGDVSLLGCLGSKNA